MTCFRLGFLILFVITVSIGCAHTTPNGSNNSAVQGGDSLSDSTKTMSASAQTSRWVTDVREAYVLGHYERVVRRARRHLRDSLSTAHAMQVQLLLGRAEQKRGNHDEAIDALRAARVQAFESDQSVVQIDRALGKSYVALYRWPAAASAFQRIIDAYPDDQAARLALAEAYRRSRQWAKARQQYIRLVRRDSSNGQWWARLANCESKLGKSGSAIQHFERAHELLPHHADVTLSLSRFYRATMQTDAAQRVVDTTLHYRPGDNRLWRRKADLAFERRNFDRARRAYEQAIATGDSAATPYRRIGMIDVKSGQYERALASLRSSFRLDSMHTRTTLYLGISNLNLDRWERASRYLQRTIEQEAQGPITEAFVQRGLLNDRRGNVSEAVRDHKLALRLRPQRTEVYFHLAAVYDEYYREKKAAARYYRRFLRAADSTQMSLRSYARDRLETLRSTLHMQEASARRDSTPDG